MDLDIPEVLMDSLTWAIMSTALFIVLLLSWIVRECICFREGRADTPIERYGKLTRASSLKEDSLPKQQLDMIDLEDEDNQMVPPQADSRYEILGVRSCNVSADESGRVPTSEWSADTTESPSEGSSPPALVAIEPPAPQSVLDPQHDPSDSQHEAVAVTPVNGHQWTDESAPKSELADQLTQLDESVCPERSESTYIPSDLYSDSALPHSANIPANTYETIPYTSTVSTATECSTAGQDATSDDTHLKQLSKNVYSLAKKAEEVRETLHVFFDEDSTMTSAAVNQCLYGEDETMQSETVEETDATSTPVKQLVTQIDGQLIVTDVQALFDESSNESSETLLEPIAEEKEKAANKARIQSQSYDQIMRFKESHEITMTMNEYAAWMNKKRDVYFKVLQEPMNIHDRHTDRKLQVLAIVYSRLSHRRLLYIVQPY